MQIRLHGLTIGHFQARAVILSTNPVIKWVNLVKVSQAFEPKLNPFTD